MEHGRLLEERTGEIHINSVRQTIPLIPPPFMKFVDGKNGIFVIHGNDFLSREVAFAMVEIEEVAKHEPTLSTAGRTFYGIGYIQSPIKLRLFWKNHECGRTLATGLSPW